MFTVNEKMGPVIINSSLYNFKLTSEDVDYIEASKKENKIIIFGSETKLAQLFMEEALKKTAFYKNIFFM